MSKFRNNGSNQRFCKDDYVSFVFPFSTELVGNNVDVTSGVCGTRERKTDNAGTSCHKMDGTAEDGFIILPGRILQGKERIHRQ
jgi:hypothetical protein